MEVERAGTAETDLINLMPSIELELYKLNTIVLTDELPTAQLDVIYIFAEPDGTLRETQIQRAVELWPRALKLALCGGTGQGYTGFEEWSSELKKRGVPGEHILAVPYADNLNTYTESVNLIQHAQQSSWKRICLIAPIHQQLRAFLSVLQQVKKADINLEIYNAHGQAFPWNAEMVHYQGAVKNMAHRFIDSEIERIQTYQAKGDLATCDEALEYLLKRNMTV